MSKPSNCKCGPGGFRIHGHNWVVLVRRPHPGTCRFKCLLCGWKWWARRRYALKLRDHQERCQSGLTDEGILERLEAGTLLVDTKTGSVWSLLPGSPMRLIKPINRLSERSAYDFVNICHLGRKKKIAVHRLVWMSVHRRTVPEGFDVDHINGKSIEFPNAIENLRLLESKVNRSRGYVSPTPSLPFDDDEAPF